MIIDLIWQCNFFLWQKHYLLLALSAKILFRPLRKRLIKEGTYGVVLIQGGELNGRIRFQYELEIKIMPLAFITISIFLETNVNGFLGRKSLYATYRKQKYH